MVRLLIALGESPNTADADGYTPLMMALHWSHSDIAESLLDGGAIPTEGGPIWGSALSIAARDGQANIINRLIRAGAKIDSAEAWSGRTALHEAVMYRNYEAIEALISAGANVRVHDKDGKTPDELAPSDKCISHLFTGGHIKDEPTACGTLKRSQV